MKRYSANRSVYVLTVTSVVLVNLVLLVYSLFDKMLKEQNSILDSLAYGSLILLALATIVYFYGNSPRYIAFHDNTVLVRKGFGRLIIRTSNIISVRKVRHPSLSFASGSFGFFGFTGSSTRSTCSLVNNQKEMFAIETPAQKFLLSCKNSDELINTIKKKIAQEEPVREIPHTAFLEKSTA